MKRLLIALFLLAFILPPLQAAGLPPGFAEDEEDEEDQAPQRADVDHQQLQLKAMLEQVDPQEVLYLSLDAEQEFLALERSALQADPKGRVVLLPADGMHPDNPQGIAALRTQLPEYGWNSLSLALPNYKPLGPPARTLPPGPLLSRMESAPESTEEETTEQEEEGAFGGAFNEEPEEEEASPEEAPDPAERLAEQQALVNERLQAALNHQADFTRQVLVLQGESLFWLLPWLQEGNWPENSPLVLLDLRVPEGARLQDAITVLRGLGRHPLLDIYDSSQRHQAWAAEERRAAYRRAGNDLAVQLKISQDVGLSPNRINTWLVKRVEGWLRSLN
ncbi:DUF3530 family protein [Marinospirillum sp.]|uniref:DUF3530 family protein n=1 Tax=Marinospirillum sp. TaxID=2183934 RepID=UPI0038503E8E